MKRRDVAAIVLTAAVVGAAGMKDWSLRAIVVPAAVVLGGDAGGPERLHFERWDYVRSIRWTGGRDLFRFVEKVTEAATAVHTKSRVDSDGPVLATDAGQTTQGDGLSSLRFFGSAKKAAVMRALFYDEEQVYVAKEGDVIGGRWRVIRIGATAAEIEDLTRHTRETVTMVTS